jgi:hypothetical protein
MRKLIALAVTTTAFGALPAVATAGPPATDANGNFNVLDVDVFPPRAGTVVHPQGVTLGYHFFAGNRLTGARQTAAQGTTIRLAGFRDNGRLFAKCPLPTTTQQVGADRCSSASQVGRGTAEADARPAVPTFIPVSVRVFNGSLSGGNPTLIFLATSNIGGQVVRSEIDFVSRPAGGGFNLVLLPPPAGTPMGLFSLTRVDVTAGKTIRVRRGGVLVPVSLIEAPRRCPSRGWSFSQTTSYSAAPTLTATDVQSCVG